MRRRPELTDNLIDALTATQVEILRALARGERRADVADRLCLSLKTINFHVDEARARLRVSGLVQCWVALGWLRVPLG